jgi:hypothetical protein
LVVIHRPYFGFHGFLPFLGLEALPSLPCR